MDFQKKMKIEAELAFTEERLVQIRNNLETQGYSKYEYDNLKKKRQELLEMLSKV